MAKSAKKVASRKSSRKPKPESDEGEHIRKLAPERAVRSYINEVIATKSRTSEAGQGLSTATKRATDQGVNIPAARIAARLYAKARADAIVARVLWEDVQYYLVECTDFNKIAPEGMFTAEESGQKHRAKQSEMPLEETPPQQASNGGGEEQQQTIQ